jgi:hypothetical protein
MSVSLKGLNTLPSFVPVPQLDGHVIAGSEYEWLGGVNNDGADIVRMSFEGSNLLRSIIVEDPKMKVIRAHHEPVLSSDKSTSPDRYIGDFEGLD